MLSSSFVPHNCFPWKSFNFIQRCSASNFVYCLKKGTQYYQTICILAVMPVFFQTSSILQYHRFRFLAFFNGMPRGHLRRGRGGGDSSGFCSPTHCYRGVGLPLPPHFEAYYVLTGRSKNYNKIDFYMVHVVKIEKCFTSMSSVYFKWCSMIFNNPQRTCTWGLK